MTKEQADELIKDVCIHANDCSYNCHTCQRWLDLLKCDYPEDDF